MQMTSVLETDQYDSQKRVFLILDTERSKLVNHPGLFGEKVTNAFPSAEDDIREAGNCLAAECNTAAVFHLMRAAQVGLRALALDRRIKLPKKEPFELAVWETIIQELEAAEEAIRNYPKTTAQEAQYAFYHAAMEEFASFKDVFRNQVMHTHYQFGPNHAMQVLEDVRGFMQTLASRITENSRTPVVWKGKKWTEGEYVPELGDI